MPKRPATSSGTTATTRGGVTRQKKAPPANLAERGVSSRGDQPSPSLSSGPFPLSVLEPEEVSGSIGRQRNESGQFVPVRVEDPESTVGVEWEGESADSWLNRHGASEMAFFSRRARSGKDPEFTRDYMKSLFALQAAKVKATGVVAGAAVRGGVDPLVAAARRVDNMSPAELLALAGGVLPSEEEE